MPHPLVVNVNKTNVKCIYIGRSREGSLLGNPYSHLKTGNLAAFKVKTIEQAVECFEMYAKKRIKEQDSAFIKAIHDCWGEFLGCFGCSVCHGEVIVRLSNEIHARKLMQQPTTKICGFDKEYRFLSNFWLSPVKIRLENDEVVVCKSVENAYQALKTTDTEERLRIANADTPGQARKMGRAVVLRPGWEQQKIEFMRQLIRQKFAEPSMRAMLIATGDAYLEETNWWNDTFWGVYAGAGSNWLGKILMDERGKIRAEIQQENNNISEYAKHLVE